MTIEQFKWRDGRIIITLYIVKRDANSGKNRGLFQGENRRGKRLSDSIQGKAAQSTYSGPRNW